MAQSLAKILIHLVYSTKHREPLLPYEPMVELHNYAAGILTDIKCHCIAVNNVSDHIHFLIDVHRTISPADMIRELKRGTSRWLKKQSSALKDFDWQDGYGAFSIGLSQKDDVTAYIRKQQEHHRRMSYQDEFRELLQKYQVPYDERYVWD